MSDVEWLPFSGLKVLDISQGVAGPYCAQILWQQGAEVIKVEPPEGDWGRHVGVVREGQSALSVCYNAGKQGVCVDARTAQGRLALRALAEQADVIVQNFRPGVVERMGVDYASLKAARPALVYVSISGYGATGPACSSPASDSVMQADSGLMFSNQNESGEPARVGILLADISTGLYAAQATSAALYRRAMTGQGMHVALSLFEACAALQANDITAHALAGARPVGAVSAPNGVFATADARLSVLALNNDQFARLCRALDRPDWLADSRYAENASRMAHRDVLHADLARQLATESSAHWIERLTREQVLHAPVRDYKQVLAHPQAQHLGVFGTLDQPGLGPVPTVVAPGLGGRRPPLAAPAIGAHTDQIFERAGISVEQIRHWHDAGVIRQEGRDARAAM